MVVAARIDAQTARVLVLERERGRPLVVGRRPAGVGLVRRYTRRAGAPGARSRRVKDDVVDRPAKYKRYRLCQDCAGKDEG